MEGVDAVNGEANPAVSVPVLSYTTYLATFPSLRSPKMLEIRVRWSDQNKQL